MSQPKSNEETVEEFKQLCEHNGVIGTTRISLSVFLLHALAQKDAEVAARTGWKGYLVVDPATDNYNYSNVYLNKPGAEKWLKDSGIKGLEIIEVDVLTTPKE